MTYKLITKTFFNHCFDKKRFQNFLYWFFKKSYFGHSDLLQFLEKLKFLGFYSATEAGLSISLEDLTIPFSKSTVLLGSENIIFNTNFQVISGNLTTIEQYQCIIDVWNRTSEKLKIQVLQSFQKFNIFNPVYLMTFSGARGNISQIKQLTGMRGLMADPLGKIIDFPIRSNFREGLTLTEYLICCSGARKGIVDTALRTAASGYLTRRLVDVAHHVIISQIDCQINYDKNFHQVHENIKSKKPGIYIKELLDKQKIVLPLYQRLIGRITAETILSSSLTVICEKNCEISQKISKKICKTHKKVLIRSPLTCLSSKFICQLCYGWNLAEGRIVSIGEAVGILAAQSIGEPGTQLTMRTFHTGGVFTGTLLDQTYAPFSGNVNYHSFYSGKLIRTSQGKIAFLSKNNGIFSIILKTNKKNILKDFKDLEFYSKKQIFDLQKNYSIFKKKFDKNSKDYNFFKNRPFIDDISKFNLNLKDIIYFNFNWKNKFHDKIKNYFLLKKSSDKKQFISNFTSNILQTNEQKNIIKKFLKKQKTHSFHCLNNNIKFGNKKTKFLFQKFTLLYVRQNEYVAKTQLLAELPFLNIENYLDTEFEILSKFSGELYFEDFVFFEKNIFNIQNKIELNTITKKLIKNFSEFWILFAKPFKNILINKNFIFFKKLDLIDKKIPFTQAIFQFQNSLNINNNFSNYLLLKKNFLQIEQRKINIFLFYNLKNNFFIQKNWSCQSYLSLNFRKNLFFENFFKIEKFQSKTTENFLNFINNEKCKNFKIHFIFFKSIGYLQIERIEKFPQKLYKFYRFQKYKFYFKTIYNGKKKFEFNKIQKSNIIANSFLKNIQNLFNINFETWMTGLQLHSKYIQNYSDFQNKFLKILIHQFQILYLNTKFFNYSILNSNNIIINEKINKIFFSDNSKTNLKKYFLEIKNNKFSDKLLFLDENTYVISINRQGVYKSFCKTILYQNNCFKKSQFQTIYLFKKNFKHYEKIKFKKLQHYYIPFWVGLEILNFNVILIQQIFLFNTPFLNSNNKLLKLRKYLLHKSKNFFIFNFSTFSIFKKTRFITPVKIKYIFQNVFSKNFKIFNNLPIIWKRKIKKLQPRILNYQQLTNQKYIFFINSLISLNIKTLFLYDKLQYNKKIYIKKKFEKNKYLSFKKYNLWELKQRYEKIDFKNFKLGKYSFIRIVFCFELLNLENEYFFSKIYEMLYQSLICNFNKSLKIKKLRKFGIKKILKINQIKKQFNLNCFSDFLLIGFLKTFLFLLSKQKKEKNNIYFNILEKQNIRKFKNKQKKELNYIFKKKEIIKYPPFKFDNLIKLNSKNFFINFKNIHLKSNKKLFLNTYLKNSSQIDILNSWEFFGDGKIILEKKKYSTYSKNFIQIKNTKTSLSFNFKINKIIKNYGTKINLSTIYSSINEILIKSEIKNIKKNNFFEKSDSFLFFFDQILPESIITLEQSITKKNFLPFNIKLETIKLKKNFIDFYFSSFIKILKNFFLIKNFNPRFLLNKPEKPIYIIFNICINTNYIYECKKNIKKDLNIIQKKIVRKYLLNFYKRQFIKNSSILKNNFRKIKIDNFEIYDFFINQKNFYSFYKETISKKSSVLESILYQHPNFKEYFIRFSKSKIISSKFNISLKNKEILHNVKNKYIYEKKFYRTIFFLLKNIQNKKLSSFILIFLEKNFINTYENSNFNNNFYLIQNKKLFRIPFLQLKFDFINFKLSFILIKLQFKIYSCLQIFKNIKNYLFNNKLATFKNKEFKKFLYLPKLEFQLPLFEKNFEIFLMSVYPIFFKDQIKDNFQYYQFLKIYKKIDNLKIFFIKVKSLNLNFYKKNKDFSEIQIIKKNYLKSFEIKIFIQFFLWSKDYEIVDPISNLIKKQETNQILKEKLLLINTLDFFSYCYENNIKQSYKTKQLNKNSLFLNLNFFFLQFKSFYFFKKAKSYKLKKTLLIKFKQSYNIKNKILSVEPQQNINNKNIIVKQKFKKLKVCITENVYFLNFSIKNQNIYLNSYYQNFDNSGFSVYNDLKPFFTQQKKKLLFSFNENNKNFDFTLSKLGSFIRSGEYLNQNFLSLKPGQFIAKTDQFLVFRKAETLFLNSQSILYIKHGETIFKNQPICSVFYSQSKTGDIVQGIPKIEEIFEARKKSKYHLYKLPLFDKDFVFFEKKITKYLQSLQKSVVNNIQRIYCGQGVYISDKHIEIIVRQITSNVLILQPGETGLLVGEIVALKWVSKINTILISNHIIYEPILLGITKTCLETSNFLSAASFQETIRVLSRAALQNQIDFLRGLKQHVILGNLVPIGTAYFY